MKRLIYIGILLMTGSAILTATGQAFWKLAQHGLGSWQLYVGFLLYGMGAVCMTFAFRFGSLSALHPLLSLGYVFSLIIGYLWLHEAVTWKLVIGDGIILIGAICLGLGERQGERQEVNVE
jgi:drug/metabolite transporter (DMT)-like permease